MQVFNNHCKFRHDRGGGWERVVVGIFTFFPDLCVPKCNFYSPIHTPPRKIAKQFPIFNPPHFFFGVVHSVAEL